MNIFPKNEKIYPESIDEFIENGLKLSSNYFGINSEFFNKFTNLKTRNMNPKDYSLDIPIENLNIKNKNSNFFIKKRSKFNYSLGDMGVKSNFIDYRIIEKLDEFENNFPKLKLARKKYQKEKNKFESINSKYFIRNKYEINQNQEMIPQSMTLQSYQNDKNQPFVNSYMEDNKNIINEKKMEVKNLSSYLNLMKKLNGKKKKESIKNEDNQDLIQENYIRTQSEILNPNVINNNFNEMQSPMFNSHDYESSNNQHKINYGIENKNEKNSNNNLPYLYGNFTEKKSDSSSVSPGKFSSKESRNFKLDFKKLNNEEEELVDKNEENLNKKINVKNQKYDQINQGTIIKRGNAYIDIKTEEKKNQIKSQFSTSNQNFSSYHIVKKDSFKNLPFFGDANLQNLYKIIYTILKTSSKTLYIYNCDNDKNVIELSIDELNEEINIKTKKENKITKISFNQIFNHLKLCNVKESGSLISPFKCINKSYDFLKFIILPYLQVYFIFIILNYIFLGKRCRYYVKK